MIKLEVITKEKEKVLYNLMQKYLYEMTLYYDDELDENGNYEYKYFPYYFTEKDRQAYFIYDDSQMIGFALFNTHSFTDEVIDHCLAEFTIFPKYRKQGNAMKAIEALMKERVGSWQLKYSMDNVIGMKFWKKVKEKYNGIETKLEDNEVALTIK